MDLLILFLSVLFSILLVALNPENTLKISNRILRITVPIQTYNGKVVRGLTNTGLALANIQLKSNQ